MSKDYLAEITSLVESKFRNAEDYAEATWQSAVNYLSDLSSIVADFDFNPVDLDFSIEPISVGSYDPARPTRPDLDVQLPDAPSAGSLDEVLVKDVDIPDIDFVAPDISLPSTPRVSWPQEPGEPPAVEDVDVPSKPDYELPDVPSLDEIVLPDAPEVDVPQMDVDLPSIDIETPSLIFDYSETMHSSDLSDALASRLLSGVRDGMTGLPADVENAIWQRARDRDALRNEQMYREAENYFASRGHTLPPGALAGRLAQVQQEIARSEQQLNYEISIEQARLAQRNTQFMITAALQYEQQIMQYEDGMARRSLQAAQYVQQASLDLFRAEIAKHQLLLERYRSAAAVYESKIRAGLALLEQYRLRLTASRLQADIQRTQVELYRTQVGAVETLMRLYATEMDAARLRLDVSRMRLFAFGEKVRVYTSTIAANTARYNAYQAAIAGEAAKVQMYGEQVRAYLGKVEAARAKSSIKIAEASARLDANRLKIEKYRADIDQYRARIASLLGEVETKARAYGYDVSMYAADVGLARTKIDGDIASYTARTRHIDATVRQALAQAEINLNAALRLHEVQTNAVKAGATVTAQMAASALSSVAAGANMSYRGGYSVSQATDIGYYYHYYP